VRNADFPQLLVAVCMQCLQKDPRQRPVSALALALKFRAVLAQLGPGSGAGLRTPLESVPGPAPKEPSDAQGRMLHAAFDSMAEGVLVLDPTGQVVRSNPAAEKILGRSLTGLSLPDWVECQNWLQAGTVTPLAVHQLPLFGALRGEETDEVEVFLAPHGRCRPGGWFVLGAWPIPKGTGAAGAVVVLRDVTALKGTLGPEKLYHSVMSLLGLNVFRKDLQGRYTFANRLFCEAVGKPAEQVVGCTDFDLFPLDLARQTTAKENLVLQDGGLTEYVEEHTTARCQPGCRCVLFRQPQAAGGSDLGTSYFHMLLAPVHDDNRRVVGIQGAFWNITARRHAERQLEQTAAALEQANAELARSNAELEQFAYVASHDLQEPLRMVASFTQLLRKRYQGRLDEKADQFIGFAVKGATDMQRLIDDLLDYSRVGSRGKQLEDTSCEEAFDRALQNLRQVVCECDAVVTRDPLPRVKGDPTQLVQLFQNLIGNALKFRSAARPLVHVRTRTDPHRREWVFCVRDNGIGIEPPYLERIFEIFQRLHSQQEYPGSGIGLAISRKIVERHGGRIWAKSKPARGSSFFFTLPAD
jgi:signal transduction histidine kinase